MASMGPLPSSKLHGGEGRFFTDINRPIGSAIEQGTYITSMHAILAVLAALLATVGMAGLALGVAVFIDAFPLGQTAQALDQPGRAAEVFTGGLSMLGLGTAAGFGAALLSRLDRIARVLENIAEDRRSH